jgi:1,2-diacylglycerol 3-beta-glucosyltransferase
MRDAYGVVVALLMSFGLAYFALAMGLGTWVERRLRSGWRVRATQPRAPKPSAVFILVPCRDEEAVIGATVDALLARHASAHLIVIDDASADATAAIAEQRRRAHPDRITVVSRTLPDARRGKGPALNAGLRAVLESVDRRRLDPRQVVVCVMDADGRLSPGAIGAVLEEFTDVRVGGVQLPVEIRNDSSLVARMVHFEFWGYSAISQYGRVISRTVSLGGNGQFTRLAALLELGKAPWSTSLTEDLDLSVSLALRGWHLRTVANASVNQQAVTTVRTYVRQRARWFQGHMTTALRIPEVWRSRTMSNAAMAETVTYLLLPFALVLPWSILGQVALVDFIRWLSLPSFRSAGGGMRLGLFAFAYVVSFLPNFVLAVLYVRRERRRAGAPGLVRSCAHALALAHLMLAFNYLSYVAAWIALIRLLRGSTTWDKTARSAEPESVGLPAGQLLPRRNLT